MKECIQHARDADEVFARVGLKCKALSFSGQDPDDRVSKDGFKWFH